MLFDPGTVAKFADCVIWPVDEPDWVIPVALTWPGEESNGHDKSVIANAEAVL